jgi:hypothetical protein
MTNQSEPVLPPSADELDRFVSQHLEAFRIAVPWFLEENAMASSNTRKAGQCSALVGVYCRIVGEAASINPDRPTHMRRPDQNTEPDWRYFCPNHDQRIAAMLLLAWLASVDTASIEPIGGPAISVAYKDHNAFAPTDCHLSTAILLAYKNWEAWLLWAWAQRHRLLDEGVNMQRGGKMVPSHKSVNASVDSKLDEEDIQPPSLTNPQHITLRAMNSFDPSVLASAAKICEAIDPIQRLSPETVRQCVNRLIDLDLAERPNGPRKGARLTNTGRRLAGKIAD